MPFELFPASQSTDRGKRKRENDADQGSSAVSAAENEKIPAADEEKEANATTDQEVDEFFAILKRLHSATKSIEKIDGASHLLMAKRSKAATATASEEEADDDEIKAERRNLDLDLRRNLNLDLNLEPVSVESDDTQRISRNLNLKPSIIDSADDSRRK